MNRSGTWRYGIVLITLVAMPVYAAPLDAYWPLARHDVAHTSYSPAKGHLDAPTVKWRLPLGGQAVAPRTFDVDFDGKDDVISIEGGRVTGRSAVGQVLWSSPQLAATSLGALGDVDGDGIAEILVAAPNRAHVVRTSDGIVLWSSPVQAPHIGFLAMGDFDGDGQLDVAVGASAGAGLDLPPLTQVVGFKPAPKTIAVTAVSPTGYDMPVVDGQAAVDIDGDGVLDFLLPGFTHFYAYSGKTGKLLGTSPAFASIGISQEVVGAIRPDPAKPPIVLFAADSSSTTYLWHGITAMQLQNGALQVVWTALLPGVNTQHYIALRGSIGDMDGDGQSEVVAAKFDDGTWQLEARDAATGSILHTLGAAQMPGTGAIGGPVLRGIVRVGALAQGTLVVQRSDAMNAGASGTLSLWQWSRKGGFVQYADLGVGAVSPANWWQDGYGALSPTTDPMPHLRTWGVASATEGDLLVQRDADGDGTFDQLEHLRVNSSGAVAMLGKMPLALGASALGVAMTGPKTPAALLLGAIDGTVAFLPQDPPWGPLNDANKDGVPDLRFGGIVPAYVAVAPLNDQEKLGRVLVSTFGRVRMLDTATAGPLESPSVAFNVATPTQFARGNFADVNGDGKREIVVRSATSGASVVLTAYGLAAEVLWQYVHPNGPWYWGLAEGEAFEIADVNGDGADDMLCGWTPADVAQKNQMTVISGKTGQDLWPADGECRLGDAAVSLDLTSTPRRIVSSISNYRFQCNASNGKFIEQVMPKAPSYGVAMLTDLDGDGVQDEVLCGTTNGFAAEQTVGFKTLWQLDLPGSYHASGALVLHGAEPLAVHASLIRPSIQVVAAKTGQPVWSATYLGGKQLPLADAAAAESGFATLGLLAAQDLTGAGHPSLLFRTNEGYLYAVNALTGAVDWVLNWGGQFGDPLVADIDGDGELEMLATASDGSLYAWDHADLPASLWARENDGTGPALSDAADIDAQESTQVLNANWATVPGAAGYLVAVLDQNGATVLPAQSFADTQATLSGLAMHLGQHYQVAVQAYSAAGAGQQLSPTTLSDGVTIVDLSAPWIDGQQLQSVAVQAGQDVTVVADLHDKTALHDWHLTVTQFSAAQPLFQKAQNAVLPLVHVNETFVPTEPGDYTVQITARDGAQHAASVEMILHVCAATPYSDTACFASTIGGDDVSGGGDVSSVPQTEDEGCGCRITASRRGLPIGSVLFLGVCLWLLFRARTARQR
jgi:hypothetical protein